MSVGRFLQQAAAGNAGGATYVDDVFSTYLYSGNNTERDIQNGLDLSGEGGLVWIKDRASGQHVLSDTENGANKYLTSSSTAALTNSIYNEALKAFNSDGFKLPGTVAGNDPNRINGTGYEYVSWTFRKQPGFFDVVTYTGDGSSDRYISHNLGSTPGFVAVKRVDSSQNWFCAFRDKAAQRIYLSNAGTFGFNNETLITNTASGATYNKWSSTEVGLYGTITISATNSTYGHNINGAEYVMYLWADGNEPDAQIFGADGDEAVIKVGTYTGNGSTNGPEIDLGFEPQYILLKSLEGDANDLEWIVLDTMRGIVTGGNDPLLHPGSSYPENGYWGASDKVNVTSTGFKLTTSIRGFNFSGANYGYVAIRRPHKPASELAATNLFETVAGSGNPAPNFISGFPVDMFWQRRPASSDTTYLSSRHTQGRALQTNSTLAEVANSDYAFDFQNGVMQGGFSSNRQAWMFRRAPGFFDVVTYDGNSTAGRTVSHNLGVKPQLIWTKSRNAANAWICYSETLGATKYIELDSNAAAATANLFNDTEPTDTSFTLSSSGATNSSSRSYVAFLFATVPGISKVGSYTGTGSDLDVDCGFTSGARFVLVKRTDSIGQWIVWDTVRGIVAGDDPYLLLSSTAAQVTNTDYIDPLSSGFTVTSTAPDSINVSGGNYIFLAIA